MTAPAFTVAPEIFERFPSYIVGWVVARVEQDAFDHDSIVGMLREAEDRLRVMYAGRDLKEESAIAVWRSAFSTLGWSASKYPSSVEALVKRAARGGSLPSINPLVDLANVAAMTYLVPVGCHDSRRSPALTVRGAREGDEFLPMGDAPVEHPARGEPVYASGSQVRTRRWVWRQSRDALVDRTTTHVLFPVDGFAGSTLSRVDAATNFIQTVLSGSPGTRLTSGMIDRDNASTPV